MEDLAEVLKGYFQTHQLQNHPMAIGCSAGVDSVVLAYLVFHHLRSTNSSSSVFLYYVDHRQREPSEVKGDVEVIEYYSRAYNWDYRILRGEQPCSSDEGALRVYRHQLFGEATKLDGISALLLAHHFDDQKEQFLLRSFRHPSPWSSALIPPQQGIIHRPLLEIPKRQLVQEATKKGLFYHEDLTNSHTRYARNQIRQNCSTLLAREDFSYQLQFWIQSSRAYLKEIDDLLFILAQKKTLGYSLDLGVFDLLGDLLQKRLINLILNRLDLVGVYPEARHEELLAQIRRNSLSCFFIGSVVIRWNADYLFFEPIVVKGPDFGYFMYVKGSFRWQEGSFSYSTALAESAEGFRFAAEGDELRIKRLPLDSTFRSLDGKRIRAKEWFSQKKIPAIFRQSFHGIYYENKNREEQLAGVISPQFPDIFWSNSRGASGNWTFNIEYSGAEPQAGS
jgi:tRNA(Ile)-lysidine synthetase-like protein